MSRRVTECKSAALPGAFPRNALKIVVSLLLMPSPLLGVSFTAAAGERIKYNHSVVSRSVDRTATLSRGNPLVAGGGQYLHLRDGGQRRED